MENNFKEFIQAIKNGDIETVEKLCRDEWKEGFLSRTRPIHWACESGHVAVVQLLLDKHCEIEASNENLCRPIHLACANGHAAVVQLLLKSRCHIDSMDKNSWRPIHWACANGHVDVVQILLSHGCHKEAEAKGALRPIRLACENGHAAIVQLLLNHGCLMDSLNQLSQLACSNGHVAVVRVLLKSGAEIEAQDFWHKQRLIHRACANGHVAIVQVLLEKGALIEVEATGLNGQRPIHLACKYGHSAVVQLLLNSGCDIEAADCDGWRPIHWACANGYTEVVVLLLDQRCKVDVRTKKGETPLDLLNDKKQFVFSKADENRKTCAKIIEESQKTLPLFDAARKDDSEMFQSLLLPLWTKELRSGQTLLDVITQVNSRSIIEFTRRMPVTDEDIIDFLSLDRNDFTDQSYKLLRQWFVHFCIRHNIDWAFLHLCCTDVVNSGPLIDGRSCLDMAVEHRRSLCVRHILHKYMTPDDSWDRAKNVAMDKGYEEIVEMIEYRLTTLQRNISMGRNRLHLAVIEGDLDMVEYILHKDLVDHSETNQNGDTPLMMAVANRMDECADKIQQYDAHVNVVNKHGQTILHAMIDSGMDALPPWLIDGAPQIEQRDCMGLTALQKAIVANLEDMAAQLVAIGADYRSAIWIHSPSWKLAQAVDKWHPVLEQVELTAQENISSLCLKLHGRIYPCFLKHFTRDDANFFDENNNTLLHLTALFMDADSCRKLLENGSAVDALNKHNYTPLMELIVHLTHHRRDRGIDDNALMTVRCLADGGANISYEHISGKTVLQMAIELLDERMLMEMVRQDPPINRITEDDLLKCLENGMFRFLEKIAPKLSQKVAHESITVNVVRECAMRVQHSTMKIFFAHAKSDVQEQVIGDVLYEVACKNDVEYFSDILKLPRANYKLMLNGESILIILIREKRWTFCKMLLQTEMASKLLAITDANGNSPLMVAIEMEEKKVIDHLIMEAIAVDCENAAGDTALSMLFQKVSSATEDRQDQLKLWIKQLIKSSADIHRVNRHNKTAISFCTADYIKKEIETFYSKQPKPKSKEIAEEIIMCKLCMDRAVNRVLGDCGHTLCGECADLLVQCPFCRALIKNRIRMLLP